jgi:uncharacterized membrane protein
MKRSNGIDALRGLAVIFMVIQHFGAWLWSTPLANPVQLIAKHPVIILLNGLGGFSAPAFITLAGAGSWFLSRSAGSVSTHVKRGLILMIYGYTLNLIAPNWFSPGSWYVLHLIGFAVLLSPLLHRVPSGALVVLGFAFILIAPALQHLLGTPMALGNRDMADFHRPFGVLRLAFAEGQFPVFPWLGFFINGIVSARWIEAQEKKNIHLLMAACFIAGTGLSAIGAAGPAWAGDEAVKRYFTLRAGFYPGFPPILFILQGLVLFALSLFTDFDRISSVRLPHFLICLGRTSLSVLFIHVFFFREMGILLGFHKVFSEPATLAITFAVIGLFAYLAVQWDRIGYRYGPEWLMRKLS